MPDFAEIQFATKNEATGQYVVGTTLNNLCLTQDSTFFELKSSRYLIEYDIYAFNAAWVDEGIFAISTLENGCLLFNGAKDEFIDGINQDSGLPDNEITTIVSDYEGGVWIAYEFGLTRAVPEIPIRSFSNYEGINGNLIAFKKFDDAMFVATNNGVYVLDKENKYRNSVYYTLDKVKN